MTQAATTDRPGARHRAPDGGRLEMQGIAVHFRGVKALDGVDLELARHEILGLIGPNGAGKTTMVNAISGFEKVTAGTITLAGQDVTRWAPQRRACAGLVRTFQGVRLFGKLTARENVEAAARGAGARARDARRRADEILERLALEPIADMQANSLPQGTERMLGIARSLAVEPSFLLLDEPAAGLNEDESRALVTTLRDIHDRWGCGILIIEHDMSVIMNLCHRVQVLDYGKTISVGTPDEVRTDPVVLRAYLGSDEGAAA